MRRWVAAAKQLGGDVVAAVLVLCGAQHGEEELVGVHVGLACRRGCRRRSVEGDVQHGADQIGAGSQGVAGFDESWVHVDDDGPLSVTITSAESAPCHCRSRPSVSTALRTAGRSALRLWLAPPQVPSRTQRFAWAATASAKFFDRADIELPPGAVEVMFGGERDPQVVADEHLWFAHSMRPTTHWVPDTDRLSAVSTRIVIGIGESSSGQACDHTSRALGARIGVEPVRFVGDHTGFVGEPAAFAAQLRAVLEC